MDTCFSSWRTFYFNFEEVQIKPPSILQLTKGGLKGFCRTLQDKASQSKRVPRRTIWRSTEGPSTYLRVASETPVNNPKMTEGSSGVLQASKVFTSNPTREWFLSPNWGNTIPRSHKEALKQTIEAFLHTSMCELRVRNRRRYNLHIRWTSMPLKTRS